MASTVSQRPSPSHGSSFPSASTSSATDQRPLASRAQSDQLPETNTSRMSVRRSIIGRILRPSVNPEIEELDNGRPASGDEGHDQAERKRRFSSTSQWDKRASRKAPGPPSRVLPELTRQSRQKLSPRIDENGFEGNRDFVVVPKVFLFPPEEGMFRNPYSRT